MKTLFREEHYIRPKEKENFNREIWAYCKFSKPIDNTNISSQKVLFSDK